MTRRDYVLISGALREATARTVDGSNQRVGVRIAAGAIAETLNEKNPGGFDKARFMTDSGVA